MHLEYIEADRHNDEVPLKKGFLNTHVYYA